MTTELDRVCDEWLKLRAAEGGDDIEGLRKLADAVAAAGPDPEQAATLTKLRKALAAARHGADEGTRTAAYRAAFADFREQGGVLPTRRAASVPLNRIPPRRPPVILRVAGMSGSVLSQGTVAVLSGEGGIAKSTLAASIADGFAAPETGPGDRIAGLFDCPAGGGPVLLISYEDPASEISWKMSELAAGDRPPRQARENINVLYLLNDPLFGPGVRAGASGLYNAAPEKLPGWDALVEDAVRNRPRLVIIDPVAAAFSGDSNSAGPVRAFLSAMTQFAEEHRLGVLILAHSTKAARGQDGDPFDPGQVGGSSHWTDGTRAALVMSWKPKKWGGAAGDRVLCVNKANWGPSRIWADLDPIRADGGAYVGMCGVPAVDGVWRSDPGRAAKTAARQTQEEDNPHVF